MKKVIKKIGNSLGIIFDREDCKIYDLKENDILELDDLIKIDKNSLKKIDIKFSEKQINDLEKQAEMEGLTFDELLDLRVEKILKGVITKQ